MSGVSCSVEAIDTTIEHRVRCRQIEVRYWSCIIGLRRTPPRQTSGRETSEHLRQMIVRRRTSMTSTKSKAERPSWSPAWKHNGCNDRLSKLNRSMQHV